MVVSKRKQACGNCWEYVLDSGYAYALVSCDCERCPHCKAWVSKQVLEGELTEEGEYEHECSTCDKTFKYDFFYLTEVSVREE